LPVHCAGSEHPSRERACERWIGRHLRHPSGPAALEVFI